MSRWKRIWDAIFGNLVISLIAAACLACGAGFFYVYWHWTRADGNSAPLWIGVPIFAMGWVFVLAMILGTAEDAAKLASLPPLRRRPNELELVQFRRLILNAQAAVARAKSAHPGGFDFSDLDASLAGELADPAGVLREPGGSGYGRWLSGELSFEDMGPLFREILDEARKIDDYQENFAKKDPPPASSPSK